MSFDKTIKEKLIKKFQRGEKDTGSAEVQIALLNERISYLTGHLKEHKKDFHSRRGLFLIVNKRRKLLNYLKQKNIFLYEELVKKLKLDK